MLGGDVAAAVRQPKDILGRGCPRCREYLAVCCNHRSPCVCPGKTGERVLGHVHGIPKEGAEEERRCCITPPGAYQVV